MRYEYYKMPPKIFAPTLLAPSGGFITTDYIKVGNTYYTTIAVTQYPREVSIGWFNDLLNLPLSARIAIYIEGVKNEVYLQKLQKKLIDAESTNIMRSEQGYLPDYESETVASDISAIMKAIAEGKEKLVNTYLFITVSSDSLDGLKKDVEFVFRKLSSVNCEYRIMTMQTKEGFINTLPGISPIGAYLPANIEPVSSMASLYPFSMSEMNDEFKKPDDIRILEGINAYTNTLVITDPFKNQNGNTIILGKTRSGKSYFTKNRIMQLLTQGVDVVVIDPLGEYGKLADALGTQDGTAAVVSLSVRGNNVLNPFDLYQFEDENLQTTFSEKIEFLLNLIEIMLRGEVTAEERSVITKAIINTYKKKGFTTEKFGEVMPTMKDFYDELVLGETYAEFGQRKNIAQKIAEKLERFVDGRYSNFFTEQTNVNPKAKLVVFNIADITSEDNATFKDIGYYIILNYMWRRVRNRNPEKPLVIVLDEAKLFLESEYIRKVVSGIIGKIAKYNAAVYLISQSVKDFGSTEGTRIVAQCGLKVLFSQDPAEYDSVKEVFSLTEYEMEVLMKTTPGLALFVRSDIRILVQVIAPSFLDPIIRTDPGKWKEWGR